MIGRRFFIDYGMGVVIGEICEIGNNVIVFQGVIFGGMGKEKGKRYLMIKDDVLIVIGVKVFGLIIVGEGLKIGVGLVVLYDVFDFLIVVGISGWVVV